MKKLLTLVSVAVFLLSCAQAPEKTEAQAEEEVKQQVDETVVKLSDEENGPTVKIREFEYRGHKYLYMRSRTYSGYYVKSFVHDPDCPCHKKQGGN